VTVALGGVRTQADDCQCGGRTTGGICETHRCQRIQERDEEKGREVSSGELNAEAQVTMLSHGSSAKAAAPEYKPAYRRTPRSFILRLDMTLFSTTISLIQ